MASHKEWAIKNLVIFKEKKVTKRVWWQCKEGHEWTDPICERVIYNVHFCSNVAVIPNQNSFKALEPKAASYWDYERNGDLRPDSLFPTQQQSGQLDMWKA
ncbi:hypothetical protein ACFSQ7_05885 [Paenibacillus rhizoplanae]